MPLSGPTDAFRSRCQIIDSGPIPYRQLPLAGDEDLERNIDAAYGGSLDNYSFELLSCPLPVFLEALDDETHELTRSIERLGSNFFRFLEGDWLDAWDKEIQERPDDSYWELDDMYPDGERRASIVDENVQSLGTGTALMPLVIELAEVDHPAMGLVSLWDGYHRLAAHIIYGSACIDFWNLLPE